jgi:hypothetical protein
MTPKEMGTVPANDNEEFKKMDRELRERVGGEFRLAAEEDEFWAMKQARRTGTLSEIAYDSMSRGDLLEVWAGDSVFRGFVRHAKGDLLVLESQMRVDVNLGGPVVLRVIEVAATAGTVVVTTGANSFSARLAEHEQHRTLADFIVPFSRAPVSGRVMIRAKDHVIVEGADSREWVVPLKWLAAVVVRRP